MLKCPKYGALPLGGGWGLQNGRGVFVGGGERSFAPAKKKKRWGGGGGCHAEEGALLILSSGVLVSVQGQFLRT